jgi:type II secretory pathway component HofQ
MLSPNGSLLVDTRSSQIFVWIYPPSLDKMEDVVTHLEIPRRQGLLVRSM